MASRVLALLTAHIVLIGLLIHCEAAPSASEEDHKEYKRFLTVCDEVCANGGYCDHWSRTCKCRWGWSGESCRTREYCMHCQCLCVCVPACVRAYTRVRVLVCVHSWVGASVRLRAAYIIYIMCAYACVCK